MKFQILVFCIFRCYLILEIETFSVKLDAYRRLSLLCVIMLTFGVPLASFDFYRINENIKI